MEKAWWVVIGILVLAAVVIGIYNYMTFGVLLRPADTENFCLDDSWCQGGGECVDNSCSCAYDVGNPDYCSGVGCVNQDTDDSNCGDCGTSCFGGHTCQEGSCACAEGWNDCGTAFCFDLDSDSEHCGECWNFCGLGIGCDEGVCVEGNDDRADSDVDVYLP